MIGLDVETVGLTPEEGFLLLVQAHDGEDTLVVDAFATDPSPVFALVKERGGVAHNANFEELWARYYGHELMLEDTMIMSRVLYGGTDGFKLLRHSLEEVARRDVRAATPHASCTSQASRVRR